MLVQFNDYFIGHARESRDVSDTGAEHDFSLFAHFAGFDDGEVYFPEKVVAHVLREMRQVHVDVVDVVVVDPRPRVFARLVRGAEFDSVGPGEGTVGVVVGRSAGEHVDFERSACFMFFYRFFGDSRSNEFGCSGSGKS